MSFDSKQWTVFLTLNHHCSYTVVILNSTMYQLVKATVFCLNKVFNAVVVFPSKLYIPSRFDNCFFAPTLETNKNTSLINQKKSGLKSSWRFQVLHDLQAKLPETSLFFICTNFKHLECITLVPLWISKVSVDLYFVALFSSSCKMGVYIIGKMVQIANWDQVSEYSFDYYNIIRRSYFILY